MSYPHTSYHGLPSLTLRFRESLSRNVEMWLWLSKIFHNACSSLSHRSVPLDPPGEDEDGHHAMHDYAASVVRHHASIKEDIFLLTRLLTISRNLLVVPEPEVPQDLCAACQVDQQILQLIVLCVNVASKGYDPESLDDHQKTKFNDVVDVCTWY